MAHRQIVVLFLALAACLLWPGANAARTPRLPKILETYDNVFRHDDRCQELTEPLCSRYGYRYTKFPNFLNHQSQEEAAAELKAGYCKLIEADCSPELPFLLCSYHFPICVANLAHPVTPCKSLCRRVKRACKPVLERANYTWPASLDCDALPRRELKDTKGSIVYTCVDQSRDEEAGRPFCPAAPTTPPCPETASCSPGKPKKKVFCRNKFGWAAQGYVAGEVISNGQHAVLFRAKKLLFTANSDLLRESMFEKDSNGYFNLTLHTGREEHCSKCAEVSVSRKEVIAAGELSEEEQPNVLFRPPAAVVGTAKASLLKKVPKHIKKCLKKLRARD